jgi:hypothetical protein
MVMLIFGGDAFATTEEFHMQESGCLSYRQLLGKVTRIRLKRRMGLSE